MGGGVRQAEACDFLDEHGEWTCTKCGDCCRLMGTVAGMSSWDRGDGACWFLTEENVCAAYENRPPVCRYENLPMASHQERAEACAWVRNRVEEQP